MSSPHESAGWSVSLIFPLFSNLFLLSDLDETSYIDSFWDGVCEVFFLSFFCIFFRVARTISVGSREWWKFLTNFVLVPVANLMMYLVPLLRNNQGKL